MPEIIDSCLQHLKIGYFLFLLILPFLFITSFLVSKINLKAYKIYQLLIGVIYYFLLLEGKLKPFILFILLILMNIIILYILKFSKHKNIYFLKFKADKFFFILAIFLNLLPLIFMKDYIPLIKFEPNYFIRIIGLSYFVLNSISMFVDYYEDKFEEFSILDIAVYSIYFPKIFAGPLVRFKDFIDELNNNYKNKSFSTLNFGLFLISIGIVKKWLADYIFQYATNVINNPLGYSGEQLFITIYIYTLYIFLDFSGYTDIARGTSTIMGINLPENFRSPYLAKNLRDFWRRWHITLYEWIRDYIYIKLLGGNRKGKVRTYINILIAFTLSGIWHGNYINYVIWGFFHGIGVILSRFYKGRDFIEVFTGWFITFNTVATLWIVFAITDLHKIILYFQNLILNFSFKGIGAFILGRYDIVIVMLIGYTIAFTDWKIKDVISNLEDEKISVIFNFAMYIFALILLNNKVAVSPFLYESF